jgi:hypothetical protein
MRATEPHNFASGINPVRCCKCRSWYSNGGKGALSQKETILNIAIVTCVDPHDVALRVNANRIRTPRNRSR